MSTTKLKGKLSPWLRNIRLKKVAEYIEHNKTILDLGCDDASLLNFITCKHYTGIDNNKDLIEENKFKCRDCAWMDFRYVDLKEGIQSDKVYDIIVMSAIIEHLHNINSLLNDIYAITTPDCKIIITTPVRKSDSVLKFGARLGVFSKESLDEHDRYYNKNDFLNLDGWQMKEYKTFEFGLNQLIVLEKVK